MTFEELKQEVYNAMVNKPEHIREGQFVFNYIDYNYGPVARDVQFKDHIDCFYIDEQIDNFINACVIRINSFNYEK